MAVNVQIHCINKQDRQNPHERITHVGGVRSDSVRWRRTQEQAIADIESDTYAYWVSVANKSTWVVVAVSRFGNKYLKTQDDGEDQNNLLSLPECPV
jgi:hypothetical protein